MSVLEMGDVFACVSMCQHALVCVVFVVLLVSSVLASMRWQLCGGDGSKKTKSVIAEKSCEGIFPSRVLINSKN